MGPRRCTINGCSSSSGQNNEHQNVTFHQLPANADTRKIWTECCRIPKTKKITKNILVCSRHFRRVDFQPLKKDKYFLKQGAVPSIFPWGTSSQLETTASNSSDSNPTNDIVAPKMNDVNTVQPESAVKAEKLSAAKQRSVSADHHLAVSPAAEEKAMPRKSLDSASTIKKDSTKVEVTPSQTDGALTKKKMDFVSTLTSGMKLEAQDFNEVWHNAKIVEVDHGEKEVLVHFEKNAKAKGSAISDEWIPMNSSRLRPIEATATDSTPGVTFKEGDKCLARWTDSRKFPATVQRVLENHMYEVLFDDGFIKIVKGSHMNKFRRPATPVITPQVAPIETPPVTPQTPATPAPKKPLKAHPIPKFDLTALNLPEIPADGEWCCQWVNDTPIGREGYLNNADGNKRPTVLVDDWRLPSGWTKHLYQRSSVSGKWDVVLVGPTNKRFRSKNDVKVYLEEHGQAYNPDVYDFSIHKRRAKDLSVYVFTDGYVPPKIPKPNLDYSSVELNTKALDSSLEGKPEPFPGFAPIDSTSAVISLPPSLNNSLNLDASLVSSTPVTSYPPLEEGYIYVGALKVQVINNLYRCPKEGCNKNFRKENHLQIHVKHYHDELSKQLGACPNMTELAYFRTVGSIDETTPKQAGAALQLNVDTPLKQNRGSPITQIKTEIKDEPMVTLATAVAPIQEQRINEILKRKPDTEIKNDDLKEKKPTLAGDIVGVQTTASAQCKLTTAIVSPVPSTSELIEKKLPQTPVHNIKTSSKLPNVPLRKFKIRKPAKKPGRRKGSTNLSKLKKFKRDFLNSTAMMFKDRNLGLNASQQSIPPDRSSLIPIQSTIEIPLKSQRLKYFQHQSLDASKVAGLVALVADGSIHPQAQRYINENGEVIKIVRMRQEEIINCLCTFGEEDGLMIQCELCLCWQHGACNNIDKESQVPEKYVCYICRHPTLGRKSMKYIHDQEWLYEGRLFHSNYHLPSKNSVQRFDILKQSHTLLGNMLELKKSLHSLNVKINIAANKDHPKMYLWSKPWDETSINNYRQFSNEMGQDQVVPKSEQNNQNGPFGNQNTIGKQHEQQAIKTNDIDAERSILNNLLALDGAGASNIDNQNAPVGVKSEETQIIRPNIPEPEAAIDSLECQRRLLDHIQKQQNLIMSRMQMIDAQIIALEAMDEHSNTHPDVNNSKTTSTIQMLLDNLSKLQKLCVLNQNTPTIPAAYQPAI